MHAWAFEGDLPEPFECKSNLFKLQWPPVLGRCKAFQKSTGVFLLRQGRQVQTKGQAYFFSYRLRAALDG